MAAANGSLVCNYYSRSFLSQHQYFQTTLRLRDKLNIVLETKFVELPPSLTEMEIRASIETQLSLTTGQSIDETLHQLETMYHAHFQQKVPPWSTSEDLVVVDCSESENMVISDMPMSGRTDKCNINDASKYVTLVSGFWSVANKYESVHSKDRYDLWFQNTLKINMPYIIFTDRDHLARLAVHRVGAPTVFLLRELSQFSTVNRYNSSWIHPEHVPSERLAWIWLEKVKLLSLAAQYTSKPFLMWIDAGISSFRYKKPPAMEFSSEVLLSLPNNRVSYCHIPDFYHSFAATVILVPRNLVALLEYLFYHEFDLARVDTADWRCGSEQFLLSRVRDKYPELFHAMCYDYGDILFLWGQAAQAHSTHIMDKESST